MKLIIRSALPFLAIFSLFAQEEQMTPNKNIGVLKRETLNEDICPLTKSEQDSFVGVNPSAAFNKVFEQKYSVKTPEWMDIPGLWPDYDGRVNLLTGLHGKYVPPQTGTPQEIAINFLTLYKEALLLGDFPNDYSQPIAKDEFGDGFTGVRFNQIYKGVNAAGGIYVTVNPDQNISSISITRQIITDRNKTVVVPSLENERIAVNLAANYLKTNLPNLKRYSVWGYDAYVIARNGIPYTFWVVSGESDCPSAKYDFRINIATSEIEEVWSSPSKIH